MHAISAFCPAAVVVLVAALTALPPLAAQTTIFNDTFADGERSTQSLPNSVAWYLAQAAPSALAVKGGVLESTSASIRSRNFWAYFPTVSLRVGDAITFTFEFRFTGGFVAEESAMRVGLCSTNGVAPLAVDSPAAPVGNYQGYACMSFSSSSLGLVKRDGPGATDPAGAVISNVGTAPNVIWRTLGSTPAGSQPTQINTTYTGVLKVVRTAQDTATVTASFTGGNLTATSTITQTDSAGIFSNFDTIIFNFPGENLASVIQILRASLTVASLASVTTQPVARAAVLGGEATFSVAAAGNPAPSFQWQRRAAGATTWTNLTAGGGYAGVTSNTLSVANVTGAMEGDQFRAALTNAAGTVYSEPATLTLSVARITNLSVLTSIASAGDSFTLGYVIGGAGTSGAKSILVRAAGPSLTPLGVSGVLDDPRIELFAGSSRSAENDNWGGTNTLVAAFAGVGAFPFSSGGSRDAAVVATVSPGDNSVRVSGVGAGAGTVIAELYDSTPASAWTGSTPRLINVSILKNIGAGLTAGFVIGGNKPQTVLVRAIGPTLGNPPFLVEGAVSDPRMELYAGSARIGENDDWGGAAALAAAFARVGAFSLPAGSKDAGIVSTLSPGNYSVQVSGIGGSGIALVEIYEVP